MFCKLIVTLLTYTKPNLVCGLGVLLNDRTRLSGLMHLFRSVDIYMNTV